YVPGSPVRANGESMAEEDDAEPAVISGRVRSLDGTPIAGAKLDIWQTNSAGAYAVQQPDIQPGTNLRGIYTSDEEGRYEVRTVRPVEYRIPDDGPVGRLLRATKRHPWRAAHVHVIVSAADHEPVVTHIFDADRPYLDSDAVFGVKPSLVRQFTPRQQLDGSTTWTLEHDFVLAPERSR
ncbi:MAG: hydroxyquinol 1,2-dioxygenase, partial [Acidimicrobiia bacterium]|nr:hydroxyquinol 1,2-dioxygenase [Acidimicrobiia bacterium]